MKIFATGHPKRLAELQEKIGAAHSIHLHTSSGNGVQVSDEYDVVFDLNFDDDASALPAYAALQNKTVLVCAVKKTLAQLIRQHEGEIKCHFIGINALPTFINRSLAEVSLTSSAAGQAWEKISHLLGWNYQVVEDSPGMVTPRVIAMLINEACFTLQEQTAAMHDIDLAMKLGLNYPWGPFEWCDRIGITDVYETLQAIAAVSGDDRYKICGLLSAQYASQKPFYDR